MKRFYGIVCLVLSIAVLCACGKTTSTGNESWVSMSLEKIGATWQQPRDWVASDAIAGLFGVAYIKMGDEGIREAYGIDCDEMKVYPRELTDDDRLFSLHHYEETLETTKEGYELVFPSYVVHRDDVALAIIGYKCVGYDTNTDEKMDLYVYQAFFDAGGYTNTMTYTNANKLGDSGQSVFDRIIETFHFTDQ